MSYTSTPTNEHGKTGRRDFLSGLLRGWLSWQTASRAWAGAESAPACAEKGSEPWSRFRGPEGSGRALGSGYPIRFGPGKNMRWRRPSPMGKSSPVLSARHVFLTSEAGDRLTVIAVDRNDGKTVWERSISRVRNQYRHPLNHAASSSVVTDGENVYGYFGDFGIVSYDAKGRERWKRRIEPPSNLWGDGASPILTAKAVVLPFGGFSGSGLAAFDKANGRKVWEVQGPPFTLNYSTPFQRADSAGRCEIVAAAPNLLAGYDPETGARRWSEKLPTGSLIASPILTDDDAVITMFYLAESQPPFPDQNGDGVVTTADIPVDPKEWQQTRILQLMAAESGNGDGIISRDEWTQFWTAVQGTPVVNSTGIIAAGSGQSVRGARWSHTRGVARVPTPLFHNSIVYYVNNGGILTALGSKSGAMLKVGRLEGALDSYYASPVAADGLIYLTSETGKVVVVRAGADWEMLACNDLDEPCYATPALSGGKIFLRTSQSLACFASG